ncbi:hypothetical protein AMTRI_Chr06g172830 [Amborella trichopoda]|uniref:Bromodomain associated domain-containing protein n=1 Tax=Amborella trichopoda TaxID=13333 RepID=W1PPT1_AMBTC|nr:uncharacterized protein LOC18438247 [Amborella trichopoda]ERN10078.1 hypothetical protein AMTR_s00013p00258000 [Amborella trichopoda]|eukprot:XP_006848497.1 uncharacterized protein LOC18438247 [Amborella trichopoda]
MNGFNEAQNTERSFYIAIVKIAVSQICEASGFDSSQDSALETFSDVATRYLETLARFAHSHSNLCGRSQCNIFDAINAIEDMSSPLGFSGASDCNRLILSSGVVKEIMDYVSLVEEIPFARRIPRDTGPRERKRSYRSFIQSGKESPFRHVPLWLPAFPDSLTSRSSSEREGRFGVSEKDFNCNSLMMTVHSESHKLDSKVSSGSKLMREKGIVGVSELGFNCEPLLNVHCENHNLDCNISSGSKLKRENGILPCKKPIVRFKLGSMTSTKNFMSGSSKLEPRDLSCRDKGLCWFPFELENGVKRIRTDDAFEEALEDG